MYHSNYNDFNSQLGREDGRDMDFLRQEPLPPVKEKKKPLWPKMTALVLAAAPMGGLDRKSVV